MRKPRSQAASKANGGVRVRIAVLEHGEGLPLPAYQSEEAAGLDLVAAIGEGDSVVIAPRKRALIPTGLSLELPKGFEGQVRPRSGLALKHGVTVLNSPGTIDSDYRGEVKIILINLGEAPFRLHRGERIAQLVVAPVTQVRLARTMVLDATKRGKGGFGSTRVGTETPARPKSKMVASRKSPVKTKS